MQLPLILASQSPRRRELLREAGYLFEIIPPDDAAEDFRQPDETPDHFVKRLAVQKAQSVVGKIQSGTILSCDTVVLCDGEILGKPLDRKDALRMLRLCRGNSQIVLSGLCLWTKPDENRSGNYRVESETTELFMENISDTELDKYLDEGSWRGKAGAFGLQDRNSWIQAVRGSETNVVGLPMELLEKMLQNPE